MTMIIGCRAYICVINWPITHTCRAAWTNSVVRPNFAQVHQVFISMVMKLQFGNPMLKPLESSNFDLGVEKVFWQSQYGGFLRIL